MGRPARLLSAGLIVPAGRMVLAGRMMLAGLIVLAALVGPAACSPGLRGLGKRACPYLRPRLIRVDTDLAGISSGRAGAADDLSTVAQDVGDYVRTNLPHHGAAGSDQPVVRLSRALTGLAVDPGGPASAVVAAEAPVKHECRVGA